MGLSERRGRRITEGTSNRRRGCWKRIKEEDSQVTETEYVKAAAGPCTHFAQSSGH